MLGQPFRFRRLEQAGTPSLTATSASWVHGPSKTRLLAGFLSTIRYNAGSNNTGADSTVTGDAMPEGIVRCEILKNSQTHEPVFRCSMEYNGNNFLAFGSSASAATQKFFQNIAKHVGSKLVDVRHNNYFHDRLGRAAALNPMDRSYSPRKNLRSDTHWIAVQNDMTRNFAVPEPNAWCCTLLF